VIAISGRPASAPSRARTSAPPSASTPPGASHRRSSRGSCHERFPYTRPRKIVRVRFRRRPSIDTGELQENWQPKLYGRLIALVLLAAYAIAFVLENRKSVSLHFVFATARVSLVWLILLALAVGFVVGILLSQLERRRRRRRAAN